MNGSFSINGEEFDLARKSNAYLSQALTYVCTIGLFKAAAAARRRLFNESLYGVWPIGVPEALLTSWSGIQSTNVECIRSRPASEVLRKRTF